MDSKELFESSEQLRKRYEQCDSEGHREPDEERNFCDYCFRHLSYKTPQTDEILKDRKHLPSIHQPYDAPLIISKRNKERESQKSSDWVKGLVRLETGLII